MQAEAMRIKSEEIHGKTTKRKPAATTTAPRAAERSASGPHVALVGQEKAEPAVAPAEREAPAADNLTLNFARKKSEIKNNIITPDQDRNSSSASPESRKEEELVSPRPGKEALHRAK